VRQEYFEAQAEGFENDQGLPELAGGFAVLKIANETHPGTGRQREIGLCQAEGLALFPDEFAYFFWCHFHSLTTMGCPFIFPTGNNQVKPAASARIIPAR